ncbi:MAG TPA: glycosyltransferase [Candidatus Angelobacter sp.]
MKITILGLTISSSWGNGHATPYRALIRALHDHGHQVHFFEKDVPYYRSHRDFESCDYCQITLYSDWPEVRQVALQTAADSDVVITASYLPEGPLISDEVLSLPRPLHVFYDLDTPVTLKGLETSGVEYLRADQIPEFDLLLSFAGGNALHELERTYGARMVRPLYGCVDPDTYFRVAPQVDFACDLSYMGTFARDRQGKLDQLFIEPARRHPEKHFVLAGSLYPWDWQWAANMRKMEHVAPHAHSDFYSSSRATLNITREEMVRNGWCPSGRFFEAAACGTPVVTDWWEGLDFFFDQGSEIRVVATAEDVEEALQLPDEELRAVADRARERTLDEHTGQIRAMQFLSYLEEAQSAQAHFRAAALGEVKR